MESFARIPDETAFDPSHLLDRTIRTRAEVDAAEAQNVLNATAKYLNTKPTPRSARFDYQWAVKLHEEMFGDVWDYAGVVRTTEPVNIGIPAHQVQEQLGNLIKDLRIWEEFGHPLIEQACRLHYRAVSIHPFLGGNGRWSRMLANIWLRLNDHPATDWPDEMIRVVESPIRKEYIAAIKAAANDGDEGPILELHRRFTPAGSV
jgi:fido (protein-threonine AMPylation protein)